MGRLWDDEILEEVLPRDQREAIRRMDEAHYMKCDIRKPCDPCLVIEGVRALAGEIARIRQYQEG